ncbi:uncharacterized protein LOC113147380 [Cyclospora cayetanensis]|uniref:Uncharacterized protein LOC113147380 n=1 Tax=Cyclospora cayetanensis TaxID=88456 RepID=A0A6P6S077_9EIME|nr:uncharacterized protein LOC113147380 [Cyclospora cayetanensis]
MESGGVILDFGASSCSSEDKKSSLPDKNFGAACGDRNLTPEVSWTSAPYETGSFILTITDVSREDGVHPHLLVWDIPENVSKVSLTYFIVFKTTYSGKQQLSSSMDWRAIGAQLGSTGPYSGPCPTSQEACIRLSLYAIADRSLGLPEGATYEVLHRKLEEIAEVNGRSLDSMWPLRCMTF